MRLLPPWRIVGYGQDDIRSFLMLLWIRIFLGGYLSWWALYDVKRRNIKKGSWQARFLPEIKRPL